MTGLTYPVSEIFYSLQGEGHFVGYPMAFIRFAGCSVTSCTIRAECDEAPWKMTEYVGVSQLVSRIGEAKIVCLTGGEPTDHDLLPLIAALKERGVRIHMETSGVRAIEGWPLDWLTVSPKCSPELLRQRSGHTMKLVVRPEWGDEHTRDLMKRFEESTTFFHRYLQPMTVEHEDRVRGRHVPKNLDAVIRVLTSGPPHPWALSTQSHRYWSVR